MDNNSLKQTERLEALEREYDEYISMLESVEIMSDNKLFVDFLKKKKAIEKIVVEYKKYKMILADKKLNLEIYDIETDPVTKLNIEAENKKLDEAAKESLKTLKSLLKESVESKIQKLKIEVSAKPNIIAVTEILKGMFERYLQKRDAQFSYPKQNGELGFVLSAEGENIYSPLKDLSGNYRFVSRGECADVVVVILEELLSSCEILEEDIEVQTTRSSGAGGQHINKTESAVRLVHRPTGVAVECQDERSQLKNKERALENLKNKIRKISEENNEKHIKNQRNKLKNAVFSDTPELIFDYDKNEMFVRKNKRSYKLCAGAETFDEVINDL